MNESLKEIIFFILIFVTYMLVSQGSIMVSSKTKTNLTISSIVVGIILTSFLVGMFYLLKLNQHIDNQHIDNYQLLDIDLVQKCRGGDYMSQGDSFNAKICREFQNSKCGQELINKHKCNVGDSGYNHPQFTYTPQSDDNWNNAQCADN